MAENSKIENLILGVHSLVTRYAKRQSVRHHSAKFWKIEWTDATLN